MITGCRDGRRCESCVRVGVCANGGSELLRNGGWGRLMIVVVLLVVFATSYCDGLLYSFLLADGGV